MTAFSRAVCKLTIAKQQIATEATTLNKERPTASQHICHYSNKTPQQSDTSLTQMALLSAMGCCTQHPHQVVIVSAMQDALMSTTGSMNMQSAGVIVQYWIAALIINIKAVFCHLSIAKVTTQLHDSALSCKPANRLSTVI